MNIFWIFVLNCALILGTGFIFVMLFTVNWKETIRNFRASKAQH